jgi:L-threo-3-deoxy-hexylosonate aldolase
MSAARTPLRPGAYAPTMTFFNPDTEELDAPTIRNHSVRLAKAGLVGLVTMGSNGEAVHLTREERKTVIRESRTALVEAGFSNVPVIAGASEQSIRGTIELCCEAAEAGAEYALVIPPSYYRAAVGNDDTLYQFFTAVADGSPLPVILYNYPGAVAGIDMDSDLIIRISQHPNIVGTKFTCANTGKLTRVSHALDALTPSSPLAGPSKNISSKQAENHRYVAFGGVADFTLQTLVSGGSAILAGGANVIPRLSVQIFNLWGAGRLAEAMELQKLLSAADWVLTKTSIPGTKSALQTYYGYGGYPRRPLGRPTEVEARAVADGIKDAMELERKLPDFAL